jgi:hypothetical protein
MSIGNNEGYASMKNSPKHSYPPKPMPVSVPANPVPAPLDANSELIDLHDLLFGVKPDVIDPRTLILTNHEPTKASIKRNGIIRAYAANTN